MGLGNGGGGELIGGLGELCSGGGGAGGEGFSGGG